jgi:hypothetical protein
MLDEDVICRGLQDQLRGLEQQIEMLRDDLEDPELTPAQKGLIRQQIQQLRERVAVVREQLRDCQTAPLTIEGVELTQGTQFFRINGQGSGMAADNSVPLVSQRQMMVRVYPAVKTQRPPRPGQGQPLPLRLSGRLRYLPVGAPETRVKTVEPIFGSVEAKPEGALDRGSLRDTLNFLIPDNDCQSTLRLTIDVFEDRPVFELAADDSADLVSARLRQTVTLFARFEPVPAFRMYPVLIHYTGGGQNIPAPSGLDFARVIAYTIRVYPIGRLEFGDCLEYAFDGDLTAPGPGPGRGWVELLDRLDDMRIAGDRTGIYVALLPEGTPSQGGVVGAGRAPGVAAVLLGRGPTSEFMAQEIAHGLERRHAPCGGAPDPDPAYPKYGSYFDGSIGEFGVDIPPLQVFDPYNTADFMGYCQGLNRNWVSPHTYVGLRNTMLARWGAPDAAAVSRRQLARQPELDLLYLRFEVCQDRIRVGPSFCRRGVPTPASGRPTPITVELVGDDGLLVSQRCRVRDPYQDPDDPWLAFSEEIMWLPETRSIVFRRDNTVIHTIEVEEAVAALDVTSPTFDANAGTLSWSGSHVDDPSLTYLVEFSHDNGLTWRTLAHCRESHYTVDLRTLAGGERCRFRVLATSGIRTTMAETDPFAVAVKRRRAHILEPRPGQRFAADEHPVLRGGGFAAGQGLSEPNATIWTSSIDGLLGSGYEVVTRLTPGPHTLTLSVPDGADGVASADVTVFVTD